ncbi:hypothetical protein MMC22_008113 [Lobaria immixta]|nr:hypothetical protein [Lobaria immixta]
MRNLFVILLAFSVLAATAAPSSNLEFAREAADRDQEVIYPDMDEAVVYPDEYSEE